MRITVYGATGGVGGHVVQQALTAGHEVTAVVREGGGRVVAGGVAHRLLTVLNVPGFTDPEPLLDSVAGHDAVISAIGPRGRRDGPVASTATRGIMGAMRTAGVRRFVALSAAPVGSPPADDSMLNRRILLPVVGAVLRPVYDDLREMEAEIAASGLDWTVVRPPMFSNKPLTGAYRTAIGGNVPRGYSISRADVAHALLAVLDDPATIDHAVGVAN